MILDGAGSLVVQFLLGPASQHRERLEARDAQQPGRDCGASLEFSGLTPDVEEHVADQVLRRCLVAYQPQYKPVDRDMVAREQHLHGEPVAVGDPSDQNLVRSRLYRHGYRLMTLVVRTGAQVQLKSKKICAVRRPQAVRQFPCSRVVGQAEG